MKKFLTLLLAAAMTLSLAACGSKTDDNSGNNSQPASALELLNAVWANYSDDDKFPAAGGDYDEANMTEDAPGNFSVEDGDALDYSLSFPAADAGKLSDAASLTHMMNANTFTAGAFHVASSSDVDSVVSDLKDNIMNRQWMCGFPDKLVISATMSSPATARRTSSTSSAARSPKPLPMLPSSATRPSPDLIF